MVDNTNDTSSPSSLSGQVAKPAGTSSIVDHTVDQLRGHASDVSGKMKDAGTQASAAASDLKDKAADLLGSAKGMASDATDKVTGRLEDQKNAGTDRIKGISDAIRRAAHELEGELPPAASYINRAADEIDNIADSVKRRDVRQLVGDVEAYARRQPAAFLGAAVLGGFAIMRLLKAPVSTPTPTPSTGSPLAKTMPSPLPIVTPTQSGLGGAPGMAPRSTTSGSPSRGPGFGDRI